MADSDEDDDGSGGEMSAVDGDQPPARPYQVIMGGLQDATVAVDGGDACSGLNAEPEPPLPGGDRDGARAVPANTMVGGYAVVAVGNGRSAASPP